MKARKFLVVALLGGLFNFSFAADSLTILFVNDTHTNLAPQAPRNPDLSGKIGGIARAASVIGMTKMTETNVLTLHGGDAFIGDPFFSLFFGVPELQLMGALGLDAMVVGNHEFDLGPDNLFNIFATAFPQGAPFSIISSNVQFPHETNTGLDNYIKGYAIKEYGGLRVGIFGLTTPSANYFSQPGYVKIIESDSALAACAMTQITALKDAGCEIIICLSHLGLNIDKQLFAMVPGVDIVISSHDHLKLDAPVEIVNLYTGGKTYAFQADAFLRYVGKINVVVSQGSVQPPLFQLIPLDENIPEEPVTKAVIDTLISQLEQVYGPMFRTQVGVASGYFSEIDTNLTDTSTHHNTAVGNLVTTAFKWKTGADIAITVGGSTSQPIQAGPIVPADLFRCIGYGANPVNNLGFRLAKINISGANLWYAMENVVSMIATDDEFVPQTAGLSFGMNVQNPPGSRITSITVNGQPIDPSQSYNLVMNEFLLMAMQNLFMIPFDVDTLYSELTEFQALTEYVISQGVINPVSGNAMSEESTGDSFLPEKFRLLQNYPNPFNPSTTITYMLPVTSTVNLKVFNSIGEEVTELVNELQGAGEHKVTFDAKNLPSGIYIYRLSAGSFVQSKKMILVK